MKWSKARALYSPVDPKDKDIQKYFDVMDKVQLDGYSGISGIIQDMGHQYISQFTKTGKILEIGFGRGRQAQFFKGNPDNYYPLEINEKYVDPANWSKFKNAKIGSATEIPYAENTFDKVVSIYNLEHIEDIHTAIAEVKRVLKPGGEFIVALPAEDSFVYNLGRDFTTNRLFSKKYGINYDKVIAFEHVHCVFSLKKILEDKFSMLDQSYIPTRLPIMNLNLVWCCRLRN